MRSQLNSMSRFIETDLRRDVFARLLTLDAAWFAAWRTGDIMARLTNDLSAVRMAAGPAIMYLANTIIGGCFALVMMARIDGSLTIIALLPMLGLPVLMLTLGKHVHARFEAVQELFAALTVRAQENLAGVRVVRAYGQEAAELARFDALGDRYVHANMRLARANGVLNPGFTLLAGLGVAITLAIGGRALINERITVGAFTAFSIYLTQLTWPLIALGWTTNLLQRGAASMGRVAELLDATPAVVPPSAHAPGDVPANRGRARMLEFRSVWFRYPARDGGGGHDASADASPWVLRDISFRVPAGHLVGLVGATGAGKSALMDLIPRVFDPQRGEILIDDIPTRELPLDVVRGWIGYAPQEALLFSDTIANNVLYGATVEGDDQARRARLAHAMQTAQLDALLERIPLGADTMLGERGINLSGGEKQRTTIARALARDPAIVLLDDSLSAVDTATEAAILRGLREALAGRTALIASHRVSALRQANEILVLVHGTIAERGSHDALSALGGHYARLVEQQALRESIERAPEPMGA
jgi:ATP-binding cassette subfamily B protein